MSTYSENIHNGDHVENRIRNPHCNSCSPIWNGCTFNHKHWWTCKNWVIEDHRLELIREYMIPLKAELREIGFTGDVGGMPDELVDEIAKNLIARKILPDDPRIFRKVST